MVRATSGRDGPTSGMGGVATGTDGLTTVPVMSMTGTDGPTVGSYDDDIPEVSLCISLLINLNQKPYHSVQLVSILPINKCITL
jgi:hypothetical protein